MIKSHLGTDAIATIERKMQNRRIGGVRSRAGSDIETKTPESRSTDRRKVERRKLIDPTTCERDYSLDEVEFMKAMDDYKRKRRSYSSQDLLPSVRFLDSNESSSRSF